ncbi:MAG: hypothetical protein A2374_00480 [Candidatus Moranbacteria bacterium RIFOXYB1_FULL_44_23]|nr:MAG: hypothetical protein A2194_04050 [Candidatus Moranbacteria bacterium RIFOXYA1_FULL_44_8]OGI34700.1 MAG: hypothetical protein A2407_03630 [Candidatus Moranbacteria bacterium RIFOXYC1_FULL_44_8]OGI40704.1 MAG: hypothetical protein A2374_00480 [Candidatus Moranbacteria bacterium RIFOXYB1_FULL_44_23]HBB36440.1 hypothetical protein [Candidatus Moranbacteria bacterium]HBU25559.1 hypothetical protein [Candidatus Moranbacteria bacterium]
MDFIALFLCLNFPPLLTAGAFYSKFKVQKSPPKADQSLAEKTKIKVKNALNDKVFRGVIKVDKANRRYIIN